MASARSVLYSRLLRSPVYGYSFSRLRAKLYETGLIAQLVRFGTVGTSGFLIDTAIVYALASKLGLYGAGLVLFGGGKLVLGVEPRLDFSWPRRWLGSSPMGEVSYANLCGLILNRGTYATLVTAVPFCAAQPVFAVAGGAIAGVVLNFTLSRQVVFR